MALRKRIQESESVGLISFTQFVALHNLEPRELRHRVYEDHVIPPAVNVENHKDLLYFDPCAKIVIPPRKKGAGRPFGSLGRAKIIDALIAKSTKVKAKDIARNAKIKGKQKKKNK